MSRVDSDGMIQVVCMQTATDGLILPVSNNDTRITLAEAVRISQYPEVLEAANALKKTDGKIYRVTKCASCPDCQAAAENESIHRFFCEAIQKPIPKDIAKGNGFPIWCPLEDDNGLQN